MKQILGYDISKWALFFHLESQSRYVLKLNEKNEQDSFITPLAEEVLRIMKLLRVGKIKTDIDLSETSRKEIMDYIYKYIDVYLNKVKVQPTLMLLASLKLLYGYTEDEYFRPMHSLFGNNILKDFVDDFDSRVLVSQHKELYHTATKIVSRIANPDMILYSDRKLIIKYKEMFKTTLDQAYGNSLSHGMEHIDNVINTALRLKAKYNLQIASDEIILAGLLHDIKNKEDRDNHHRLAFNWVMGSIHPELRERDKESRNRIAYAILEHRASSGINGNYYSPLSELIATADRALPDINAILLRMYNYQLDRNPKIDNKEAVRGMLEHLEEKYSRKGYITYPKLYMREYGELEQFYKTIDRILSGKVKITISKYNHNIKINLKR